MTAITKLITENSPPLQKWPPGTRLDNSVRVCSNAVRQRTQGVQRPGENMNRLTRTGPGDPRNGSGPGGVKPRQRSCYVRPLSESDSGFTAGRVISSQRLSVACQTRPSAARSSLAPRASSLAAVLGAAVAVTFPGATGCYPTVADISAAGTGQLGAGQGRASEAPHDLA